MNTYSHEDELLRTWMDDGVDVAPLRAVESALQRISTTRQRRELALLRRIGVMDLAGRRHGPAAWRAALAAVAVVGVVALSLAVVGMVLPRLANQGSAETPSRAAERVIGAAASAQPAGTALKAVGPDLEEVLSFLVDRRSAGEILAMGGATANAVIAYQGADDSRRFMVAAIIFDDEEQASAGLGTFGNAFRESRSTTGTEPGSWYAAPANWIANRGTDVRLFLGPNSVVTSASPGVAQVWRTGRAVVVVVGVAVEPALSAEIGAQVNALADAAQAEVDRLMR